MDPPRRQGDGDRRAVRRPGTAALPTCNALIDRAEAQACAPLLVKRCAGCAMPACASGQLGDSASLRPEVLRHTRYMADLGYDANFLTIAIAPPTTSELGSAPLNYMHFTVQMHPIRRLAWWVAWNVDGLRLFPSESISRSGERFRLDPRVPATAQTGEAAYADNDLDRGHIARRSDLLWGALDEALRANSDSFYFTNITPQHQDFNQSGRGGAWGLLENAVLGLEGLEERRLSLFAGPVLNPRIRRTATSCNYQSSTGRSSPIG